MYSVIPPIHNKYNIINYLWAVGRGIQYSVPAVWSQSPNKPRPSRVRYHYCHNILFPYILSVRRRAVHVYSYQVSTNSYLFWPARLRLLTTPCPVAPVLGSHYRSGAFQSPLSSHWYGVLSDYYSTLSDIVLFSCFLIVVVYLSPDIAAENEQKRRIGGS